MLDWALQNVQGMSVASTFAVVVLTVLGMGVLRRWIQKDNRKDLGLKDDETLDTKIHTAVEAGSASALKDVMTEVRDIGRGVALLGRELEGVRKAQAHQGVKIEALMLDVAGLTAIVHGPTGVAAMRTRVQAKLADLSRRTEQQDAEDRRRTK